MILTLNEIGVKKKPKIKTFSIMENISHYIPKKYYDPYQISIIVQWNNFLLSDIKSVSSDTCEHALPVNTSRHQYYL